LPARARASRAGIQPDADIRAGHRSGIGAVCPRGAHASGRRPPHERTSSPRIDPFSWPGPDGEVTLTVTHTRTFFGRAHVIDIAAPEGARLPLETLSYLVTDADLQRAGGAVAFVAQLLAKAASPAGAPAPAQSDLFDAPRQPERRRPRRTPSAPTR
jgi:hypothetical protein